MIIDTPSHHHRCHCFIVTLGLSFIVSSLAGRSADAAAPAIKGYTDFVQFTEQVRALARPELCRVTALATSPGGRSIWLLTIGRGDVEHKPAILMVGNVDAAHLVGSELTIRMAKQIIAKADEQATKELLDRYTFYMIPRPNPDGSEAFFRAPLRERAGNDTPTDDDRDHQQGEDPPNDLNRDGVITMMRVTDPAGRYMPHPSDERVLIEADAKKNEVGRYSLYIEGKDDDHDESFNEDGSGGVSFNRNWTFKYPFFTAAAGPNQVSEPETRAVADFAFDHSNIAAVFCFSLEDNLMHPWKPADNQGRIKTAIQKDDAAYGDYIAEQYHKATGSKDAPPSPAGAGGFGQWAYFHYGRWSFAARGWWVPKVEAEKADAKSNGDKQQSDSRAADQVNALRWLEREKIDGFIPWTAIEHPDFPNKKVEVGGIKPFVLLNPPVAELDALADKHTQFIVELSKLLARLELTDVKAEPLGGGVYRVSCQVLNNGYLPTMSEMGRISGAAYPLQIELQLPAKTNFLQGTPRAEMARLAGRGGKHESRWLIRTPDGKPAQGKILVYAPAVGKAEAAVELP
jgi:hypothetical protein